MKPSRILIAFLLFLLALPGTAFAAATITLSPTAGHPKTVLELTGAGFSTTPELVDISFNGSVVAVTATKTSDKFSQTFEVPGIVPGTYSVLARGRSSGLTAQESFVLRTDWAQFRNDAAHTGYNPYENVLNWRAVPFLQPSWTAGGGDRVSTPPAVGGGVVIVRGWSGLYAFDAATGAHKWDVPMVDWIHQELHAPAIAGGLVYVVQENDGLYAYDAATGALKWRVPIGEEGEFYLTSPTIAGGIVCVATENNLYAFDAATGATKWTIPGAYTYPAMAGGVVYVGRGSELYAFDAATGAVKWSASTGGTIYGSPAVAGGVVYVPSTNKLYAFKADTGKQKWNVATEDGYNLSSPAVADGVVYVVSRSSLNEMVGGKLYAFKAATGAQKWTAAAEEGYIFDRCPAVAGGVVYVGSFGSSEPYSGKLYAFKAATGAKLWDSGNAFPPYGQVNDPVVADGRVYINQKNISFPILYTFTLP